MGLNLLKSVNNYLPKPIKINMLKVKYFDNIIFYVEPFRKFFEVIKNKFSIDIFIKRVPRLLNEPYTKEMSLKIVKKVTEKSVVRLVKIAAGASI